MAIRTRTIQALQDGVAALLTRQNLDSVNNLFNAFERAFRTFQQKATVPEAMTSQMITLYDGVKNYIAPTPIFGSTVKDARPVGQNRFIDSMVYRQGGEDFDRKKDWSIDGYGITFETENGVNIMRVNTQYVSPRVVLDPMNAITGWVLGGTASLLAQDTTFYYAQPASLRFTLTGTGSGYIEKTLINPIDMTIYQNVAKAFLALELPTLNLSSIELRLGSDNSNYYVVSATEGQLGAWTTGDFLDTPFDLSTAVTVGTPNIKKINYVRLTFATTATITNIRCGYLSVSLPSQHKFLFTTTGIFKAEDKSINNFITDVTDVILLNDAAYNLYEHECALTVGLQEGGTLAGGLMSSINSTLNGARAKNGAVLALGLYDKFRADNPSEDIRLVGNWYED